MALTMLNLRAALVTALEKGLGTTEQQISGYVLVNYSPPVLWVRPRPDTPIMYHQAMGALRKHEMLVEAITGVGSDIAAQQLLDEYVGDGSKSVFSALEADLTLGGVVQNITVTQCRSYVEFKKADGNHAIGANWLVEVLP